MNGYQATSCKKVINEKLVEMIGEDRCRIEDECPRRTIKDSKDTQKIRPFKFII
jgi:hypothetical protein